MVRRALLCGINDYQSANDLRGCVHDVENLSDLLMNTYGFREADIRVLTNQEVTKSALEREWERLLEGAGAGDTLVFHFSGHGSFVRDDDRDEDDGNDEIFCLYDMDFRDANTYLRDDELNAWTAKKPAGSDLVILTDCCHSGTNTKMITEEFHGRNVRYMLDQQSTLQLAKATGNTDSKQSDVLVRFLEPDNYQPSRKGTAKKKPAARAEKSRTHKPLNHLHLGACQDHEKAADAPLGGKYNGAFTYYLCKLLRERPNLGSTDLMRDLRSDLGVFSQQPVENGSPKAGPIFGRAIQIHGDEQGNNKLSDRLDGLVSEQTARRLIGVMEELNNTLKQFSRTTERSSGDRKLVYVHGIDEHPGDYSLPWWEAMKKHVNGLYGSGNLGETRLAVHWSDIVNPRSLSVRDAESAESLSLMRTMLEREIAEASTLHVPAEKTLQARAAVETNLGAQSRGGGPQLDDFLRYMYFSSVRTSVLKRFTDIVRPRLESGDVLDIISHSWGTVVAYEGLLQLEAEGVGGRIANFFTVGSALSLGMVRWQLGLRYQKPNQVENWYNLDAKGDGVGGTIGRYFPITREYLNLEPGNCKPGYFSYDLACAHGSYFQSENEAVNKDIFARHLLEF